MRKKKKYTTGLFTQRCQYKFWTSREFPHSIKNNLFPEQMFGNTIYESEGFLESRKLEQGRDQDEFSLVSPSA